MLRYLIIITNILLRQKSMFLQQVACSELEYTLFTNHQTRNVFSSISKCIKDTNLLAFFS